MRLARLLVGLCLSTSLFASAPARAADPFAAFGIQGNPFAHPGHEADLTFVWMASGPSLQSIDIFVELPGGILPIGYAKPLPEGYVGGCCPSPWNDGWVCNWRTVEQGISVEALRDEISLRVLYEPYRFVKGDTSWVYGEVDAQFEVEGVPVRYDGDGELELTMGSPNDDDGGLSLATEWSFDTAGYASVDFYPWQQYQYQAARAIGDIIGEGDPWTGYYVPMRIDLIADEGFDLSDYRSEGPRDYLTVELPCNVVLFDYDGQWNGDFYLSWCSDPYETSEEGCLRQTCEFEFDADFGRFDS